MRGILTLIAVSLCGLGVASAATATIELNGATTTVRWSDGDSFKIKDGKYAGSGSRLMGYNTLESYGPVHSWGEWSGWQLFKIAKEGKDVAGAQRWICTTNGDKDHYGRVLVLCPKLIEHMVGEGQAHLFYLDEGKPTDAALAAQKKAMAEKKGIWAKGVPTALITSLHSADEGREGKPYNRVADPQTGMSRKIEHEKNYGVCEKICMEGSCMLYVPFKQRYGSYADRAPCLRPKHYK